MTPLYLDPGSPRKKHIDELSDQRIIRIKHIDQKEHIEIFHDAFAPIISRKYNQRLEKKRRSEKRRYQIFIGIILLALMVVSYFLFYALDQEKKANQQKEKADQQTNLATANGLIVEAHYMLPKNNLKALRIAESAYKICPYRQPRLMQVLGAAAASTLREPFYQANFKHNVNYIK